jgi:hypothetical protein
MPRQRNGWLFAIVLASLLAPPGARAASKLEGYYSVWSSANYSDQSWKLGKPSHYSELKFINTLDSGVESYFKLRVNADSDDDLTDFVEYYAPPWIVAEGHLKFRGSHTETTLFSRQNHFWINDIPLFGLVNDWKLKNDSWGPQSQGVRFEFWDRPFLGLGNWGGTLVYSDDGGTYYSNNRTVLDGVDSWIARLRNNAWNNRLAGGLLFLRKDWTVVDSPRPALENNQVFEADIAFFPRDLMPNGLSLGPLNLEQSRWTLEYATSSLPGREISDPSLKDDNTLFGAEFRDVNAGSFIFHGWYHRIGQNFRDYLAGDFDEGGQGYNRTRTHLETIFFVPRKAITAKGVYERSRLLVPQELGVDLQPSTSWYSELYVEFINGFKGRVAHRYWRGFDSDTEVFDYETYQDVFAELSVENFLAKIRLQYRLHDFGTFRESSAYGFDMNVNITDRVKGYLRMLDARDTVESRQTVFAQLKYDLGFGAEFYFEYGNAGQSDNLVYTDWFIQYVDPDNGRAPGTRQLADQFALSFKTWF